MTALSKKSIFTGIRSKKLVISPILSKDQVGLSSVDLRMGTVVLVARSGALSHVDPTAYREEDFDLGDHDYIQSRKQKHERFDIPFLEPFLLHPGSLALVPTLRMVLFAK